MKHLGSGLSGEKGEVSGLYVFQPGVCDAEYKVCGWVCVFAFKVLIIGIEVPLVMVLFLTCLQTHTPVLAYK